MLQSLLTAWVAILLCTGAASGHTIQLKAHSRECFHEQLHRDDRMTVTFQVGDREFGNAGNLDIDFFVRAVATYDACSILTPPPTDTKSFQPIRVQPEVRLVR